MINDCSDINFIADNDYTRNREERHVCEFEKIYQTNYKSYCGLRIYFLEIIQVP